jgi:hypothetical protein
LAGSGHICCLVRCADRQSSIQLSAAMRQRSVRIVVAARVRPAAVNPITFCGLWGAGR